MYLALLDVESRDKLGLLGQLDEDGLFGAWTFEFGDRPPVSRDLLDSVNEINYLDTQMGLSSIENLRVLDIGAGYGRLAHRMSPALPGLAAYDCIDGVAISTFLCDYYRGFRQMPEVGAGGPARRAREARRRVRPRASTSTASPSARSTPSAGGSTGSPSATSSGCSSCPTPPTSC